jgi:hypothetical protein
MRRSLAVILASAASAAVLTAAMAAPRVVSTPNVSTNAGATSVVLGGQTFVNKGLVGASRLTANARDFLGDSLGSFSGMSFAPGTWRRLADGSYTGGLFTLPDRGPNFALNGFPGNFFSNYNGRLNAFSFTFNPYTGSADLAQSTASQNQMVLTPSGGVAFKDFAGRAFTGIDPGNGLITQNGFTFGAPSGTLLGSGLIAIDAEAVTFRPDGSFYVSDEYQAGIFHFRADGQMIGYIPTVNALLPRIGGTLNFSAADAVAGSTGRRNNQGMEGLSLSPDGNTLFVMLQSAALQDSTLGNDDLRNATRLIAYDVSTNATPTTPFGEWVMELPVFNRGNTNGTAPGGAANRTAAQSEIFALNSTQLLVLSRDGNGKGNDPTNANTNDGRPMIFKSILLIDTAAATNIAGTARETAAGGKVTTTAGVLDPAITPVAQVELVNILNTTQLRKFGLNTNVGAATNATSISEKWEAMGLLPVLEEAFPQDFFLFVGNDNDFQTTNGQVGGGLTNGTTAITSYNSGFNNDSTFLVYRLTLPTYVDSQFLQAMVQASPVALDLARDTAETLAGQAGADTFNLLNAARRVGATSGTAAPDSRLWGTVSWTHANDIGSDTSVRLDEAAGLDGTIGYDRAVADGVRVGVALTYGRFDEDLEFDFSSRAEGGTASLYGAFEMDGFFLDAIVGYSRIELDRLDRPSAYGMLATGTTDGEGWSAALDTGYMFAVADGVFAGPVASLDWTNLRIEGYTELNAAGGNVVYQEQKFDGVNYAVGAEIFAAYGSVSPSLRVVYNFADDTSDTATVKLASVVHSMATQSVVVGNDGGDAVTVSLGVQGADGDSTWFVGYDAGIAVGDGADGVAHRLTFGGAVKF